MTDRELLEAAAKAAGVPINRMVPPWNPLIDDGEAFRLMASLGLDISFVGHRSVEVCWIDQGDYTTKFADESINDAQDYREATRRAIVRAAATMAQTKETP